SLLENRQAEKNSSEEENGYSPSDDTLLIVLLLLLHHILNPTSIEEEDHQNGRQVIDVKGGPEDVVWVVQLSDLHFSVHNPERARDFKDLVGPSLSFINPSLVLITGDLTDGKSKDLLTMKQDEAEWVEYEKVMQDVIERSGLDKDIFYDVRGNHDAFGVPTIGGLFDFFSKHSINARLGRSGQVNSVTVQVSCSLHFIIIFLAYMLSLGFWEDPQRYFPQAFLVSLSMWASAYKVCIQRIWEWEMGDWRKSRAMRILSIDRGFLSFVDIDFELGAYSTIRTLVFSSSTIASVVVRIYDSRPGNLNVVLESSMNKHDGGTFSRGDLYVAPWNFEAFEDPSPDRYWLQVEATDIAGRNFIAKKSLINGIAWVFKEFYAVPLLWLGIVVYLFYLLLCPWVLGKVFTDGGEMGFMTFKGWVVKFNKIGKLDFIGVPDIMVVVLPHLFFVILPTILVTGALAVERGMYRERFLSLSGKKEDDHIEENNGSRSRIGDSYWNGKSSTCIDKQWIRNIVLVASLAIFWKHLRYCFNYRLLCFKE
ncbi:hypothetical protein C3L33_20037, partial [Rhododendron williamsianum]